MSDETQPGRLRWVAGYFDSVGKIVGVLAAVVALISGVVGLYIRFWPEPPPVRSAELTNLQFRGRITLETYLRLTGENIESFSPEERTQFGHYYVFTVETEGLQREAVALFWSVLSDEDVSIPNPELWIRQLVTRFTPRNAIFRRTAQLWIQSPPIEGTFYAQVMISAPETETLDEIITPPFKGTPSQQAARPVTVQKTVTKMVTVPERTETTATIATYTSTTGVTTVPTTTVETIPATTTTVTTIVTDTVFSPVPLPRPPVVGLRASDSQAP